MPPRFQTITSVTRWLIVVVFGCAILEMAQPMTAAPESKDPAPALSADTVLYPKNSTERPADGAAPRETRGGSWLLATALLLALGGTWLVLKRRGLALPITFGKPARAQRLIAVEETKSLGNRQYLVVAACEGRRFLLGVTPGRIDLLSPLDDAEDSVEPSNPARDS